MGAAVSSLQTQGWLEFLTQPKVLTAIGLIIASTAFVFLGLLRSKRFKGTYSIDVKEKAQKDNECTSNRAHSALQAWSKSVGHLVRLNLVPT
jgi:hypothetical protein